MIPLRRSTVCGTVPAMSFRASTIAMLRHRGSICAGKVSIQFVRSVSINQPRSPSTIRPAGSKTRRMRFSIKTSSIPWWSILGGRLRITVSAIVPHDRPAEILRSSIREISAGFSAPPFRKMKMEETPWMEQRTAQSVWPSRAKWPLITLFRPLVWDSCGILQLRRSTSTMNFAHQNP